MQWILRFAFVIFCTALVGAVINLGFTVWVDESKPGFRGHLQRFLMTLLLAFACGFAAFAGPLMLLFAIAGVLSWWHGDPAAGGALGFLMIGLGPICVLTAIAMAIAGVNRRYMRESKRKADFEPGRRRLLTGDWDQRET
jgi:hypothetical protein